MTNKELQLKVYNQVQSQVSIQVWNQVRNQVNIHLSYKSNH